eukprot:TRINITY_DN1008_c0_g3_i1.p1 TRINITY_DN1008_c0_g3~~TRINITY_DN1008_c0_g3_i1.p1  ORF type:complete len:364 (+),score=50.05 TRINITY_DN1008_c0_g3_i1:110-1201(+)
MIFFFFQVVPLLTIIAAALVYSGGGMLIPHSLLWGQHAATTKLCSMGYIKCGEPDMDSSVEHRALHDILKLQSDGGIRNFQKSYLPESVSLCGDPERTIEQNRDGLGFGLKLLSPYNPVTMPKAEVAANNFGLMINSNSSSSEYVMVYIHGGGFAIGSPEAALGSIIDFSEGIGHTGPVLACRYPLSPETKMPGILAGTAACVDHMKSLYPNKKILLAGDSAGGSLILYLHRGSVLKEGKAVADGYLLISPGIDLSITFKETVDPLLTKDLWNIMAENFLPAMEPEGAKYWSPSFFSDKELANLPHTWMWIGGADPLAEAQVAFSKRFPSIKTFNNNHHFHDGILFYKWYPSDMKPALAAAMP